MEDFTDDLAGELDDLRGLPRLSPDEDLNISEFFNTSPPPYNKSQVTHRTSDQLTNEPTGGREADVATLTLSNIASREQEVIYIPSSPITEAEAESAIYNSSVQDSSVEPGDLFRTEDMDIQLSPAKGPRTSSRLTQEAHKQPTEKFTYNLFDCAKRITPEKRNSVTSSLGSPSGEDDGIAMFRYESKSRKISSVPASRAQNKEPRWVITQNTDISDSDDEDAAEVSIAKSLLPLFSRVKESLDDLNEQVKQMELRLEGDVHKTVQKKRRRLN
ncbi:hypothetical protein VHEMI10735 [[Torrubiella] hemipterigena]|uniref:Uncharacterized protein n=1 Tax=[Torrubiella] hemipterigena TaxID=1531966 RepID=A0A0A1TJH6_9HYPO|nr:hypothetical protein VHEMI10735 [[Torrubiella] hemipterigena]